MQEEFYMCDTTCTTLIESKEKTVYAIEYFFIYK